MISACVLDRRLLRLARTRGHRPWAERVIGRVSALGEHGALWLGIGVAGGTLDPRGPQTRRRWRRGAGVVALAYALNTALKALVGRRRPQLAGLPPLAATPSRLSFPSAHATTGFTAARAYRGLGPGGPLYGMAGALAVSRVYLGVHYPSDVAAGALLGTAIGARACR